MRDDYVTYVFRHNVKSFIALIGVGIMVAGFYSAVLIALFCPGVFFWSIQAVISGFSIILLVDLGDV